MTPEEFKNRTKKFAIEVVKFCEQLPPRISMLAVGANYRAACRAKSTADFINKLKIVEEEIDESVYFLELVGELDSRQKTNLLIKEGNELLAMIVASINTTRKKGRG